MNSDGSTYSPLRLWLVEFLDSLEATTSLSSFYLPFDVAALNRFVPSTNLGCRAEFTAVVIFMLLHQCFIQRPHSECQAIRFHRLLTCRSDALLDLTMGS